MAVTDLTNTKWVINSTEVQMQGETSFDINFISNNTNYIQMYFSGANEAVSFISSMDPYNADTAALEGSRNNTWVFFETYLEIEITGGAAVQSASLLNFFNTYATQIEEPSSDVIETTISVGNNLLTDASIGTTKLLKAFIGSHLIFERLGGNFLTSDGKVLMTSDNKIFNVQPGGFSGNILEYGVTGNGVMTYIKFDTAPSSFDDYDSRATVLGEIDGLTSYNNKSKVYAWGEVINTGKPKVKINNVETEVSESHTNPTEIILNGDYDIYLGYAFGTG